MIPDVLVYAVCVNDADPADLFLPGGQRWRFARGVLRAFARATALTIPETVERYGDFDRFEHDARTMRAAADRAGTRFVVAVFDNLGFVETVDRYEASIRRAGVEPVPFACPLATGSSPPTSPTRTSLRTGCLRKRLRKVLCDRSEYRSRVVDDDRDRESCCGEAAEERETELLDNRGSAHSWRRAQT